MGGGGILGGLLGSKPKSPEIQQPTPVAQEPVSKVDPKRGEAVAEARRRRVALSRRTGRPDLRVDLSSDAGATRSGISIR